MASVLVMDPAAYCREVERYLCQKNEGHLIRIVGPAFELVRGWAARGVPLKVVLRGIDLRVARTKTRGPRRRPLRIEFCEADVLDQFDEWRRAVGVLTASRDADIGAAADGGELSGRARPRPAGLPQHLDRVMTRLTTLLIKPEPWPGVHDALDRTIRQLDAMRNTSKTVRGEARAKLLDRLTALDQAMLDAVREGADVATVESLRREAALELTPFRARMPAAALARAEARCTERLLRARLGLPRLSLA